MKKAKTVSYGCLTGMISLVIVVIAVSIIDNFLYNAPFHYEELLRVASPNASKHAHLFTNTNNRDNRAPYSGVCVTHRKRLSREYDAEVFSISPTNALTALDLVWIDNETLELKFSVDSSVKARIHYGRSPPGLAQRVIFTERFKTPKSTATDIMMESKK